MSNLTSLVDKLNSIKLDKSLLLKLNTLREDSKTKEKILDYVFKAIRSKSGLWTISIGSTMLSLLIAAPLQISNLKEKQEIKEQYKYEANELAIVKNNLKVKNIEGESLQARVSILETYLSNSSKIVYLPEVIRLSLLKNNIELISFTPSKDEDNIESSGQSEAGITSQNMDEEDYPPIEEYSEFGLENEFQDNTTTEELKLLKFRITARGDYLNALESLKDLQEYKSIVIFERINFAKESNESGSESSSEDGTIQMDFIISIPTKPSG